MEKSETVFSHSKETMTVDEMKQGIITSNYAISHAVITLTDKDGTVLLSKTAFCTKANEKEFSLGSCLYPSQLSTLAKESPSITVTCRLSTGEIPAVYQGTLIP